MLLDHVQFAQLESGFKQVYFSIVKKQSYFITQYCYIIFGNSRM